MLAAGCCAVPAAASAEVRQLTFFNTHTSERATIVFKRDGAYDPAGLKQINHILRDWRRNEEVRMDPELLDLIWQVYRETGATQPIHIVCGYRAPETNGMLRSRSRGVAKHSQHMLGKALDFFIPGVDLTQLRLIGMKQQFGGVGIYTSSNFVHMDVGSVRTWPNRLSRQQLLALFPDGKTLHLPSDGGPLPGYNLAMAEFKRNHTNRNDATWDDDDDVVRPVAGPARAVAANDVPPAPPSDPGRIPAQPAVARASVLGALALAQPRSKPDLGRAEAATAVDALAFGLPRPKPQQPGTVVAALPEAAARPVPMLAGPRPSPSAADALAVLAGDDTRPMPALGYAPQPGPAREREQADAVALGRAGKTVVASLPGAGFGTVSRAVAAPKADRGEPLARLLGRAAEHGDAVAMAAQPLPRLNGPDVLRRNAQDGVTAFYVKPSRVIAAAFTMEATRPVRGFAGPAVVALATRPVE